MVPPRQWRGCSLGAGLKLNELCPHPLFGVPTVGRRWWESWAAAFHSSFCLLLCSGDS